MAKGRKRVDQTLDDSADTAQEEASADHAGSEMVQQEASGCVADVARKDSPRAVLSGSKLHSIKAWPNPCWLRP